MSQDNNHFLWVSTNDSKWRASIRGRGMWSDESVCLFIMKVMINQRRSTGRGFVAGCVPKQGRGQIHQPLDLASSGTSVSSTGLFARHWSNSLSSRCSSYPSSHSLVQPVILGTPIKHQVSNTSQASRAPPSRNLHSIRNTNVH